MKREDAYFEQGNGPASFSVLHPPGASPDVQDSSLELDPGAAHDLRLDDLVGAFAANRAHQKEIRDLLSRLPRDPAVIAYRQAVLEDLLANPALAERFTALLPLVDSLADPSLRLEREMPWLHALAERAARLQNLIDCLESLGEALGAAEGSLRGCAGCKSRSAGRRTTRSIKAWCVSCRS